MAITSYCKKCGQDVPVSDICENCGAKLSKSAVRSAWCVEHTPVKDWISWNAAMRILLPLSALVLALILLLEGLAGGLAAVEELLRSGLILSLIGLLLLVTAMLLLVFILQGDDWLDCAVDSQGLHVNCYLPNPTPLKLLLRLRSPALMREVDPEDAIHTVLISRQELPWKAVSRVQLWSEKSLILCYAPAWWLRLALPCTPFTYEDSMTLIQEKLGRKKGVILPVELVAPPKAKAPKAVKKQETQLSFADIPMEEAAPLADAAPVEQSMPAESLLPLDEPVQDAESSEADGSEGLL